MCEGLIYEKNIKHIGMTSSTFGNKVVFYHDHLFDDINTRMTAEVFKRGEIVTIVEVGE